ncbi:hypothetical protein L195_g060183, partial [Trifolium pratense]
AVERALKILYEYQHSITIDRLVPSATSSQVIRNNICWSPPPENYLKLNVDAHLSDDGR